MSKKLGIMGVGMVGNALKKYFEKKGIKPLLFDNGKELGSLEDVNQADVIFICVPTPFDKDIGFDLSCVREACNSVKGEKIIVIKSTITPGTTEKLQKEYPRHKILFNPEFLTEANADRDLEFPDRQLVGWTEQSRDFAKDILELLPRADFEKIMPSIEAEMAKYFANTYLAIKVIFAEQMYELCEKLGVNYENVMNAASIDKRIGASHLVAKHKGYHGYGGHCFPKDMKAIIQFADSKGVDLRLHKVAEDINNELMKKQGISDPEKV